MVLHRKLAAVLAAVTAALAVAVPAASAHAATTPTVDPQVCQLLNSAGGPFGPVQVYGGASLANVLTSAGSTVGCAAPAPTQSPLPTMSWWG
jgi:hypothetical protein